MHNYKILLFPVATQPSTETEDEELAGFLTSTKLYIVIACIAALVLVAVVQASCTIYKMATKPSNVTTSKVCISVIYKLFTACLRSYVILHPFPP